ncbi:MAG: hypothetical protein GY679_01950 [Mycoplasma sp.]|nr:hypothetical protein [Mycoplasma sp.]
MKGYKPAIIFYVILTVCICGMFSLMYFGENREKINRHIIGKRLEDNGTCFLQFKDKEKYEEIVVDLPVYSLCKKGDVMVLQRNTNLARFVDYILIGFIEEEKIDEQKMW